MGQCGAQPFLTRGEAEIALARQGTGTCTIILCERGNHYHLHETDRSGGNVAPGAAGDAGGATAVQPQRRRMLSKMDRRLLKRLERHQCSIDELKLAAVDPWLPQHLHDRILDWLRVIEKPEAYGG